MYFTDTPELRKFEREMRQKPNFDRRNDKEEKECCCNCICDECRAGLAESEDE